MQKSPNVVAPIFREAVENKANMGQVRKNYHAPLFFFGFCFLGTADTTVGSQSGLQTKISNSIYNERIVEIERQFSAPNVLDKPSWQKNEEAQDDDIHEMIFGTGSGRCVHGFLGITCILEC